MLQVLHCCVDVPIRLAWNELMLRVFFSFLDFLLLTTVSGVGSYRCREQLALESSRLDDGSEEEKSVCGLEARFEGQ